MTHPGELSIILTGLRGGISGARTRSFFVTPMRRHPEFSEFVHGARANLHFKGSAVSIGDHGVKRTIAVRLRTRDVVIKLIGHRDPQLMHQSKRAIAISLCLNNDAHGTHIEQLAEIEILLAHLVVDAVDVFGSTGDVRGDTHFFEC